MSKLNDFDNVIDCIKEISAEFKVTSKELKGVSTSDIIKYFDIISNNTQEIMDQHQTVITLHLFNIVETQSKFKTISQLNHKISIDKLAKIKEENHLEYIFRTTLDKFKDFYIPDFFIEHDKLNNMLLARDESICALDYLGLISKNYFYIYRQ